MSMTIEKAIEEIRFNMSHIGHGAIAARRVKEAKEMAINALEEIQQYRAIGTVEELRELKEKGTAKKPIPLDKYGECHECPTCGGYAENNCGCAYRFCPTCGTEFDWSEGKE